MNNVVIYTCIKGNYDTLPDHSVICDNADYICFTDNPNLNNNLFKLFNSDKIFMSSDNQLVARFFKWNPHILFSNYKYSIWVDSSIAIKHTNFFKRIDELIYSSADISIAIHPNRNNIYEEGEACRVIGKENNEKINNFLNYANTIYKNDNKLYFSAVVFRKHNEKNVIEFNNAVWDFIRRYTKRDQLIIPVVSQIQKLDIIDFNNGERGPIPILGINGTFWYNRHGNFNRNNYEYEILKQLANYYNLNQ